MWEQPQGTRAGEAAPREASEWFSSQRDIFKYEERLSER